MRGLPATSPPTFAAQVTGRADFVDSMYTLVTMPRLNVTSKWFLLIQEPSTLPVTRTGTETLILDRASRSVTLTATTTSPKLSVRFVSDGTNLSVFRTDPNATPSRTFFRVPLTGEAGLREVLYSAGAVDAPLTRVARAALLASLRNDALRVTGNAYRADDRSVIVQSPRTEDDKSFLDIVRRYRFDAAHLPLQIEEWTTQTEKSSNVVRTTYLQQQFTYAAYPTRTDLFVTKPAAGDKEVPPPDIDAPFAPGPDKADAKARALLQRWARAWARFTSLNARVHMKEWTRVQSPDAPPPDGSAEREAMLEVSYCRPGKLSVSTEPFGKPNSYTLQQNFISNGKTLVVFEKGQKRGEATAPADDTKLHDTGRNNGFWDFSEVLPRLMGNPQELLDTAEAATYRGVVPLPGGGKGDAVTITTTFTDNGVRRVGRPAGTPVTQQTVTLYFDSATGFPLRSEFVLHRFGPPGTPPRDLPPDEHRVADYQNLRLNQEMPSSLFDTTKVP